MTLRGHCQSARYIGFEKLSDRWHCPTGANDQQLLRLVQFRPCLAGGRCHIGRHKHAFTHTSGYDPDSNRTSLEANIGGTVTGANNGIGGSVSGGTNDFQNSYTYDNLNQLIEVAQQGNGGNSVSAKSAAFSRSGVRLTFCTIRLAIRRA